MFGMFALVSAQTFYVQNEVIQVDANSKADLVSKTNAQIDLTYSGKTVSIKPLFETAIGTYSYSTFSSANLGTTYSTTINKNAKFKWKQNFNLPAIAATNLKAIYYEVVYPKGIDAIVEGNKLYLPDGVVIGFQDLVDSGFIIRIINSTLIKIEGVSKVAIELDPEIIVYQTSAKMVYDSWISYGSVAYENDWKLTANYGASVTLGADLHIDVDSIGKILIAFNTSLIPVDANVTSARVAVFQITSGNYNYSVDRVMANWSEGVNDGTMPTTSVCGVTWNYTCLNNTELQRWFDITTQQNRCSIEGQCDIFLTPVAEEDKLIATGANQPLFFQNNTLTDLAQQWINGTADWKKGLMFNITDINTVAYWVSSESTVPFRRPRLVVTFTANLTINTTSSTSTTPNSPITVLANFKNSGLPGNGSEIYGGKYLLNQNQYSRRTAFRFGAFVAANKSNDCYTAGRDGGSNESIFVAQNGTVLAGNIDGAGDATDARAIDVDGDGIDEIMRGAYAGTTTTGAADLIYKNGTIGWSTLIANGQSDCGIILIEDFDMDGKKDIGVGCIGNFSVYNASATRQLKYSFAFGNATGRRAFEAKVATLDGSNTPELAIAWGNTSGSGYYGISVFNATKGSSVPIYYHTLTGLGKSAKAVDAIDVSQKGTLNAWIYSNNLGGSTSTVYAFNRTSAIIKTLTLAGLTYDLVVGDFDNDGKISEFAVFNGYYISANGFNADNSTTKLWDFTHPFLLLNRSGYGGSGVQNNILAADVDGDNRTEVIVASSVSGWVFILNGATGALKASYELPNKEQFMEGFNIDQLAKHPILDVSRNTTDNSTLIGFGSASSLPAGGWLYAYEITPCKISLPSGASLRAMNWNVTNSAWYYYNNTGLPEGNYNYTIYCDGNFSGYGAKVQNGSLTFISGVNYTEWYNVSVSNTSAGATANFIVDWTSNYNFSGFIFSMHNGEDNVTVRNSSDLEAGTQSFNSSGASGTWYSWLDGFESGSYIGNWTIYKSNLYGLVVVDSHNPRSGTYGINSTVAESYANLNELISAKNLAGSSKMNFSFYQKDVNDEETAGTDHADHYNSDAYYFTCDGTNWKLLGNLPNAVTYNNSNSSVDSNANWCGVANSSFKLKIAHYMTAAYPSDGRFIDDINITYFKLGQEDKIAVQYDDVAITGASGNITEIVVYVNVSNYSTSCSQQYADNNVDLKLSLYNGAGWSEIGEFNGSSIGWWSLSTQREDVLDAWLTLSNRDIRIAAIDMNNCTSSSYLDKISWNAVIVSINDTQYFTNDTFVAFADSNCTTPKKVCQSNVSKTINPKEGMLIRWYVWANITEGRYNQTDIFSFYNANDSTTIEGYWLARAPTNVSEVTKIGNSYCRRYGSSKGNGNDVGCMWRNNTLSSEGKLLEDEERHCATWWQFYFDEQGTTNGTIDDVYCHVWVYAINLSDVRFGFYGNATLDSNSYSSTIFSETTQYLTDTISYPFSSTYYYLGTYWLKDWGYNITNETAVTNLAFKGTSTTTPAVLIQALSYPNQRTFCIINKIGNASLDDDSSLRSQDTDGDGLNDYTELWITRTDPYDADTDGDGYSDSFELSNNKLANDPYDWGTKHIYYGNDTTNLRITWETDNNNVSEPTIKAANITLGNNLASYFGLGTYTSSGDIKLDYNVTTAGGRWAKAQVNIAQNISESVGSIITTNSFIGYYAGNSYSSVRNSTFEIMNLSGGNKLYAAGKKGSNMNFYIKQTLNGFDSIIGGTPQKIYSTVVDKYYTTGTETTTELRIGWIETWIITGGTFVDIVHPTTIAPITVGNADNITVNFTFYESDIEIVAGLSVVNITIGETLCSLGGGAIYSGNHWYQNCTTPNLVDGSYDLTIIANTSTSGLKSDTEINAITYSTATISFTVFTLGGGGNFTTSMITSYGNSTEAYYYNATGLYSSLVKPCANANAVTYCQNGMNTPQYSVINTGNTQFKFYMKLNQPLAVNNVKLCANSSGSGGTSNTLATCVFGAGASDEGNLNGTSWLFLGDVPASGARLNITSYMNFSYVLKGEWSNIIYMNTTT